MDDTPDLSPLGLRRGIESRRRVAAIDAAGRRAGRRWSDDPDLKGQHEHLMVQLSRDLHCIRDRLGWSLDQWAYVSGVHADTIMQLEQARTDPQVSTLIRLLYPAGFTLQIAFRPGRAASS